MAQLKAHVLFPRLYSRRAGIGQNPQMAIGLGIILIYTILTLLGPLAVPHDPLSQDLDNSLQGFSLTHPLGTDDLGRDILSRILSGGRLTFAILAVTIIPTVVTGSAIGIMTGYFGGLPDLVIMRLIDILMAVPGFLLALVIVSMLGRSIANLAIAIGFFLLPRFVRISRGAALKLRHAEYVMAAKAIGATPAWIMVRHILPNCISPIVVQTTLEMGAVVVTASGLSFLGLGVHRPTPEWGLMLSDGRQYLRTAPHVPFVPGLTIAFLVLGFTLLGNGLRDLLDPKA